jgi:phosphoglycerate dehydrogenase-like enzyme
MLKHGAMLINVSRGGLIDSDALFGALESGQVRICLPAGRPAWARPLPA